MANTERLGPDGFRHTDRTPDTAAHCFLDAYLAACLAAPPNDAGETSSPVRLSYMLALAEADSGVAPRAVQVAVVRAATGRLIWGYDQLEDPYGGDWWANICRPLEVLLNEFCRGVASATASIDPAELDSMLRTICLDTLLANRWMNASVLAVHTVRTCGLSDERRGLVWKLADFARPICVKWLRGPKEYMPDQLDAMTNRVPTGTIGLGEAWAELALSDVASLQPDSQTVWNSLLHQAMTATAAKPSKVWLRRAEVQMATLGWPAVEDMLMRWFDSATKPHVHRPYGENATILRGLLWCCAPQAGETLIRSIGRLADAMFKKIPDIGPRSPKVGNACLYVTTQHQHVDLERAAAYHT